MSLLTCRDLSVGYDGKAILEHLNFSVEAGEYLAVVGENGSGKSTLMKTILGLLPPVSGQILTGEGLTRGGIGYLPQQTAAQKDFPASVREVVLSGRQNCLGWRPFYRAEDRAMAVGAMERMHIENLAGRCYRELSGGQQQRVLLARALCAAGRFLLLDEPVTGLDPKATAELYALIEELNTRDRITVLMISHDIRAALRYADRILHIGDEVFFGTKESYLESPAGRLFITEEGGKGHEHD